MPRLRIVIADDHETVRDGLKFIVNAQPDMEVVGEAGDGQTAIEKASRLLPDVVVMDVSMPEVNGLRATEVLHQQCPQVKVLTLTRHAHDGYLQQLLRAGASGYVLKQSRSSDLLQAIRAVGSGGTYLDPSVTATVLGDLTPHGKVPRTTPDVTLTPREDEVLRLIAWGYSNKEIAARLDLSVKTIETHKAHAMQKLGLGNRIEVVRYALLKGWLGDT